MEIFKRLTKRFSINDKQFVLMETVSRSNKETLPDEGQAIGVPIRDTRRWHSSLSLCP